MLLTLVESVTIELVIGNPLSVPLLLKHASLQYTFTAASNNAEVGNCSVEFCLRSKVKTHNLHGRLNQALL